MCSLDRSSRRRCIPQSGHFQQSRHKVLSLNSLFCSPGPYEVEFGISIRQIIEKLGGGLRTGGAIKGVLIGGPLAGIVPPHLSIEPVGESKPDWEIICDLARAMGKEKFFNFQSPDEIWNEIRSVWKAGAGISYERLEHGGLQWPCPAEDHPGTQLLHKTTFSISNQVALRRVEYRIPAEAGDNEYPFILNTGRTLYQFNAGTMTVRTPNAPLSRGDFLEIST